MRQQQPEQQMDASDMLLEFRKLLFSEMRLVTYKPGKHVEENNRQQEVSDSRMVLAVTANENLRAMGYMLSAQDLCRLADSPELCSFPERFRALVPDVKAKPMYPDFPKQVMEISSAQFRFQQYLHYWSTYGTEYVTGLPVHRGWLPEVADTQKVRQDAALFRERYVELVPEEEAPLAALKWIMARRERMTFPQKSLVRAALRLINPEDISCLKAGFKENLIWIFPMVLDLPDRERALGILRNVCQNTGDVLKCAVKYLAKNKYRLRTSQKKRLVLLLESFPVWDLRENVVLSGKKKEQNLVVLQYIDYNQYSRSAAHRKVIADLRSGKLHSFEGAARYKLKMHTPDALLFAAQRPGYMFRWLRWMQKLGYKEQDILTAISAYAGKLSTQTIVTAMEKIGDSDYEVDRLRRAGEIRLQTVRDNIWGEEIRLWQLWDECDRLSHQDYVSVEEMRLRRKVENAERCFVPLTETILQREYRMPEKVFLQDMAAAYNQESSDHASHEQYVRHMHERIDAVHRYKEAQQKALLSNCSGQIAWHTRMLRDMQRQLRDAYAAMNRRIHARYAAAAYDAGTVSMCRRLLAAHFAQVTTPLQGKKVFLDLDEFDLAKSYLACNEKSGEGGYIPSGIVFRIPDKARYVRFFIYWNDNDRVDIDLHAKAHRMDGSIAHIGWNSEFRGDGIVFSGDITHSDAAEYIDIDLAADLRDVVTQISLFSGKSSFAEVEECYVGLMAVSDISEDVALYDPKNCFFAHEIRMPVRAMQYGVIDILRKCVWFCGEPLDGMAPMRSDEEQLRNICRKPVLSLDAYLQILFSGQKACVTEKRQDADVILSMGKSAQANAVSLVDNNFFLDSR